MTEVNDEQPFLSLNLNVYGKTLSYFSIISQLSTIQDVSVSEFKVELMFPSDETTKNFYSADEKIIR